MGVFSRGRREGLWCHVADPGLLGGFHGLKWAENVLWDDSDDEAWVVGWAVRLAAGLVVSRHVL